MVLIIIYTACVLISLAPSHLSIASTFRTHPKSAKLNVFGTEVDLNNIMDLKLKNQANTNVLNWGGKLLAYFEAGLPHRWVGAATVIND